MKISRAPFRVSLFGGGTDFAYWYNEHCATIISLSINRYCYVTLRELLPFYKVKYRVSWSEIENRENLDDIKHPSVRECLKYMNFTSGVEIHTDGDLPARSGLGSSSTFTVAMLHACHQYKNININMKNLAKKAIHIEQNLIGENVGIQDQIQSSYGGFNIIDIDRKGDFQVTPISLKSDLVRKLEESMVLVYSDIQRLSSEIQAGVTKVGGLKSNLNTINEISKEVSTRIKEDKMEYRDFVRLLDESWKAKASLLQEAQTSARIMEIFEKGIMAGADCGKILGAGGGGFIVFFVDKAIQQDFVKEMNPYICISPKICNQSTCSLL